MRLYVFIKHDGFSEYGDYGNILPNVLIRAHQNGEVIRVTNDSGVIAFASINGSIPCFNALYKNFPRLTALYLSDKLSSHILLDVDMRAFMKSFELIVPYTERLGMLGYIRTHKDIARDILATVKEIPLEAIASYSYFDINTSKEFGSYCITNTRSMNNKVPNTFLSGSMLGMQRFPYDEESAKFDEPIEHYIRSRSMKTFPLYYTLEEALYSATDEVYQTLIDVAYTLNIPKSEWGKKTINDIMSYKGDSADTMD